MEFKKRLLNEDYHPIRKNNKARKGTCKSTFKYQPKEPIGTKQEPKSGSKIKIKSDTGEKKTGGVS